MAHLLSHICSSSYSLILRAPRTSKKDSCKIPFLVCDIETFNNFLISLEKPLFKRHSRLLSNSEFNLILSTLSQKEPSITPAFEHHPHLFSGSSTWIHISRLYFPSWNLFQRRFDTSKLRSGGWLSPSFSWRSGRYQKHYELYSCIKGTNMSNEQGIKPWGGVTRQRIMEIARDHGYQVEQRILRWMDWLMLTKFFRSSLAHIHCELDVW